MDINKKIEEIRQKPEHIRIRYVWGMVAVSMLFIVTIWIFSISDFIKESKNPTNTEMFPDLKENFDQIKSIQEDAPSIKEIIPEGEQIQDLIPQTEMNNPGNESAEEQIEEGQPALPIE